MSKTKSFSAKAALAGAVLSAAALIGFTVYGMKIGRASCRERVCQYV